MDTDNRQTTTTSNNTFALDQLRELEEAIKILTNGIQTLDEDVQELNEERSRQERRLEELIENVSKVKAGVEEERGLLDAVHQNLEILRQDLTRLEEQAEEMQVASYDGTLLWKITQVAEKLSKYAIFYIRWHQEVVPVKVNVPLCHCF